VSRFGHSVCDQFVTLHRGTDVIDCQFRVNWQERYTMLKLGYETCIARGAATCDTAYGSQARPAGGSEEPMQQWADLTGEVAGTPYGLAVLNDSKYGFDAFRNELRVTVLRSPSYAHHDPDRYDASRPFPIMDQGWHRFRVRLVPHAGSWLEAGVVRKAWELNEPVLVHLESAHPGALPGRASFLEADAPNVHLTVLKKSEDGDVLIVRGYESAGVATRTNLRLPFSDQVFEISFGAYEVKTLQIDPGTWRVREVDLLEHA